MNDKIVSKFLQYFKIIIDVLKRIGDSASITEVCKQIEKDVKPEAKLYDYVNLSGGYLIYGRFIGVLQSGEWILTEFGKNVSMTEKLALNIIRQRNNDKQGFVSYAEKENIFQFLMDEGLTQKDISEMFSCSIQWVSDTFAGIYVRQIVEKVGVDTSKISSKALAQFRSIPVPLLIDYCKKLAEKNGTVNEATELLAEYRKSVNKLDEDKKPDLRIELYAKLLLKMHNLILHGAPGTGKTYLAKNDIAPALAELLGFSANDVEVGFVQFHPSYDYTDFVEGIRPRNKSDDDKSDFDLVDGVFKKFCVRALKNTRNNSVDNYDEIIEKFVTVFEENDNQGVDIPLLSGKSTFRIALNSNGDGFITLIKQEDGSYVKDSCRF